MQGCLTNLPCLGDPLILLPLQPLHEQLQPPSPVDSRFVYIDYSTFSRDCLTDLPYLGDPLVLLPLLPLQAQLQPPSPVDSQSVRIVRNRSLKAPLTGL